MLPSVLWTECPPVRHDQSQYANCIPLPSDTFHDKLLLMYCLIEYCTLLQSCRRKPFDAPLRSSALIWPHLASSGLLWPHQNSSELIWPHLASFGLI